MKKNIKVSIIIPVYNCEKYLDECLISVEKQTYNNLEIIIINDGSTDHGIDIINRYIKKHSTWRLINQTNQGLSMSRNNGFDVSSGEYVFFLDSDDEIPMDAIEKLVSVATENNSDVVIGNMINYNSTGKYPNYTSKYIKNENNLDYKKFTKLLSFIHAAGKLYKRDIIKKIKFISGVKHEDNYFNLSIFLNTNKISMIKDDVYYHRVREGNDKSITQSLNYNTFKDLLINYNKVINENDINLVVNKILSHKVINYIFLYVEKNNMKYALDDMDCFFRILDSKTECMKYRKIINKLNRKIYMILVKIKTKKF